MRANLHIVTQFKIWRAEELQSPWRCWTALARASRLPKQVTKRKEEQSRGQGRGAGEGKEKQVAKFKSKELPLAI